MRKWYKYIGIIVLVRYWYKKFLLFKLQTDTHIGFEYYHAKKRYDNFKP